MNIPSYPEFKKVVKDQPVPTMPVVPNLPGGELKRTRKPRRNQTRGLRIDVSIMSEFEVVFRVYTDQYRIGVLLKEITLQGGTIEYVLGTSVVLSSKAMVVGHFAGIDSYTRFYSELLKLGNWA